MNNARNERAKHDAPPTPDDRRRQGGSPTAPGVGRSAALCLASLAVMAPWPLLGILLLRSSFDDWTEASLLLGGITLFPLMILAFFNLPEAVFIALIVLVWVGAALVPVVLLRRRLTSWPAVSCLLVAQAGFSFAQAFMGALLVVGKSV